MRALDDPNHPGNRPVCENAGVYVWTGVDPGPCSEHCPKHGVEALKSEADPADIGSVGRAPETGGA